MKTLEGKLTDSKIFIGPEALEDFCKSMADRRHRIFLLTDTHTYRDCAPILMRHLQVDAGLTIGAGESFKTLETCAQIWEALSDARMGRGDLLLTLGGGMVCDIGGFTASTYKRGMPFVHMPTSLLAMADAAIGGKTGIDFMGFKNQIGSFQQPQDVVVHEPFLQTLPQRELRAGYAEVLKQLLIHDRGGWQAALTEPGLPTAWERYIAQAIVTKLHFTEADPMEKSIRKALNFGHSIGHAIESHFLTQRTAGTCLHGEAVAAGIWCETWLSLQRGLVAAAEATEIQSLVARIFPQLTFGAEEIPQIAVWCLQDKKNANGQIMTALLDGIGGYKIDQPITIADAEDSLRHYLIAYA